MDSQTSASMAWGPPRTKKSSPGGPMDKQESERLAKGRTEQIGEPAGTD